jgi:protein O-mannosyl-transferase
MSPGHLNKPVAPGPGLSLGLVLAAIAISFRAAPFLGFVDYDDPVAVLHPHLQGGLTLEALKFALTASPANLWHPLTFLSHALDFELYGAWAGGHHLSNLFWHLASCAVLLVWLRRSTGENGLALAVTLLFAIHPLRVESAIWISERKDVLSLFFYLLTIAFYSEWTAADGKRRRRFYFFSLLAAACGVLSKPSLMTLPAVLLLVDLWPLQRLSPKDWKNGPLLRARIYEKIPFVALALIAAAIAWATWSGRQDFVTAGDLSLAQRGGFAALTYLAYLERTFLPINLAAFEPYPLGAPLLLRGFAVALLTGITALAMRQFSRSPWFCVGWLWFLATILPGSGLITISDHFAPDRYTYLAHIGLGFALIWEIAARARARGIPARLGWGAMIVILIPLSLLTTRQSLVWKDAESLWRHAISAKGPNYLARNQLGMTLIRSGRVEEGLGELQSAVKENPKNPMTRASLAIASVQHGDLEGGIGHFEEAGLDLPERERIRAGIIAACLAAGRRDLATALWKGAATENPGEASVQLGAGDYFYGIEEYEEALRFYFEAAKLDPKSSRAALNIGALLIRRGTPNEAIPWVQRAIATAPDAGKAADAHRTLAQIRILQRSWGEAIGTYEKGLALAPDRILMRNELAQLLLDCPDASLRAPARALELARDFASLAGDGGKGANPRYLRTYVRALVANGRGDEAKAIAAAGLQSVATLRATEPLAKPWTTKELDSLTKWFGGVAGTTPP